MAAFGSLRLASLGVLLFLVLTQNSLAQDRFNREINFNIAAQSVEEALIEFSKQAGVQVMVGGTLNGQTTDGVKGRLTVATALQVLLKDTGLEYRATGNTVTIRSIRNARADAKVKPLLEGVRLASSESAGEAARGSEQLPPVPALETLDEVIVTGSHISGQQTVGAQLITLDRTALARTGLSTVQDVIRTLPQNFGGGPSEDSLRGVEANTNNIKGTAVNLRGLGAGATLVLINGRRLAPAGTEGSFTDISSIPLTAVEQIDVLPDGASAVYGSDAIGGVVNVRMRRDFSGLETFARAGAVTSGGLEEYQLAQSAGYKWDSGSASISYEYFTRSPLFMDERDATRSPDLTRFGGDDFRSPFGFGNPGTITDFVQTWAIPANQNGIGLTPSSFTAGTVNFGNANEGWDLLSDQTRHSVYAGAQQDITDQLSIYADVLYTNKDVEGFGGAEVGFLEVPPTNPYYVNPTGDNTTPVFVTYSFFRDLGPRTLNVGIESTNAALGTTFDITPAWRLKAFAALASEKADQSQTKINQTELLATLNDPTSAAFNPFGDGSFTDPATLARLRDRSLFSTESELVTYGLSAEGTLWDLPGGGVRVAVGAERREPTFKSTFRATPRDPLERSHFDREISAAYAEAVMPLLSRDSNRFALNGLSLSLAARMEDYSDFGSATTPRIGLDWEISSGVKVRAAWSKAFKAPNLPDMDESHNSTLLFDFAPDPQSPTGFSPVLLWAGKNADLQEERARSRSLGLELGPELMRDTTFSLTYFDVEYEDRIQGILGLNWLVEPRFASIVTRNPTPEQRQLVCGRSVFDGVPSDCLNAPIVAIVDLRLQNTAVSQVSGLDLLLSHTFKLAAKSLTAELNGSYFLDFSQALTQLDPLLDMRNTPSNPIDLRIRGSLSWQRGGFTMTGFVNYADGYKDTVSVPNRSISSWTTVDMQVSYETGEGHGWYDGLNVALSAQNVFDEDPPFFNNPQGFGYDAENADLIGRMVSLQVRKRW